jgi:C-terminal processing protease CtpA/Prc
MSATDAYNMSRAARSRVGPVILSVLAVGWICCLSVIGYGWNRQTALTRENEDLRAASRRVEELRQENQRLQGLQVERDELERYRKQAEEVHKLRAQYQEWQRLQRDYAALELENARLRAAPSVAAAGAGTAPANRGVWIGIGLRSATDPATGGAGVAIASVIPGGPAANSGLRPGDLIVAVNGKPLTTLPQVKEEIRAKPVGTPILVDVLREGTRLQFSAMAEPLPVFE